jgi:hypothetical protein
MAKLNFGCSIIPKESPLEKHRKRCFLLYIVLLFLLQRPGLTAQAAPKELPVLVAIKDLLTESNPYDGHRVVVAGRIRSMELQTGRRGGEFIMLILEEDAPDAAGPDLFIEVVSLTIPKVRQGDRALVQGVYHREGKQAGRPFERFIDADTIIREKS